MQDPAESAPLLTTPDAEAPSNGQALDSVVFQLNSIAFEGAADRPRGELEALYADVVGEAISLADLRTIAARTERYFQRLGYRFTRVVVPEQRIENGAVQLRVIRGYVSEIRVIGGSAQVNAAVARMLSPLRSGEYWRDQDAERQILLAQEIPGVTLAAEARRGVGGPGAIELVARVREDVAGEVALSANNLGSNALGPWSAFVHGSVNNVFGWADRTRVGYYSTTDGREQRVAQFGHEAMLSPSGVRLIVGASLAEAHPGGAAAPLDLRSEAVIANIEMRAPLVVSRANRLDVSVGLDWVDQYGYVFDTLKLTDEHLRVFYVALEGRYDSVAASARRVFSGAEDAPHARPMFPFTADYSLELRQGLDGMGASKPGEARLSRVDADPQALSLRWQGTAQIEAPGPFSLRLHVRGQHSEQNLASYEEFAIGNFTIVRGYDPSAAAGDQGVGGRLELQTDPFRLNGAGLIQPFAFVDSARIWNPGDSTLKRRDFSSYGVGVRASMFEHVDVELAWARPLHRLTPGGPRPDAGVQLNIAVRRPFGRGG
ncbi:MAG TPA: ShlB/FhaC/HecB family hemolysin secretion/activation protein [Terricaulis sp.]|nr:ShlB/FhaC/HecB family hemolysin secretion/activation protein [Terricaulis sp.]